MAYTKNSSPNTVPGYRNNTSNKPKNFYHTDFEKSLENIVTIKEPEEKEDILGKVFSDKSKTLKSTIKALFNEILLRKNLDDYLINKINYDIRREQSYLDNLKNLTRYNYSSDLFNDLSKTKMQLENIVLDLEKEKRREYLECWRDLLSLRKYLMSTLKDYWELNRKKGILTYGFKDFNNPENENNKGY